MAYEHKHNDGNLEHNRDGTDDNRAWNSGAEGPTDDPGVLALRERRVRSQLATLLLSRGVPMLLGGDELARSQGGNNNAWCQDNAISWYAWTDDDHGLRELTTRLIALRRSHPVFHGQRPLDVRCFDAAGREMDDGDRDGEARDLVVLLEGEPADHAFLLCFNGGREPLHFTPSPRLGRRWTVELATDRSPDVRAPLGVLAPFAMAVLSSPPLSGE